MRTLVWSLILFFSFGSIARAQDKLPDTPTDDEINLMLSQLERAMDQYEVLIIQEDKLLAGVHEADTTTDKRLVDLWKVLNKGLRGSPQKFNSQGGFDLLILIDDAARNAALAATNASKQATQEIIAGRTEKAELLGYVDAKRQRNINLAIYSKRELHRAISKISYFSSRLCVQGN